MTFSVRDMTALGSGSCVLVGALAGLPFHFLGDLAIGIPAALVTAAGIFKFWPSAQEIKRESAIDAAIAAVSAQSGIDSKEVIEAINTATTKLTTIRKHAAEIHAPNTKRRIERICKVGDQIVEDFRIDPKDVRAARSWIGIYLDQTIDLVKAYSVLSRTGSRSIDAQQKMAGFDNMLDLIETEFNTLLKSLVDNDVAEFDINTAVMRDMLKQEGIQ